MKTTNEIKEIKIWSKMRIEKNIPAEDRIYEKGKKDMANQAISIIDELQAKIKGYEHATKVFVEKRDDEIGKLEKKLEIAKDALSEIYNITKCAKYNSLEELKANTELTRDNLLENYEEIFNITKRAFRGIDK